MPDKDITAQLATALNEIKHLKEHVYKQDEKIEDLERWKKTCGLIASWWAGVCMLATLAGATLVNYWDKVKGIFVVLGGSK